MRDRLILAFTGLAFALVVLYAVPRAYFIADLVRDNSQERLDRTASLVAMRVDVAVAEDELTPELLAELRADGERIVVELPDATITDPDSDPDVLDDMRASAPLAVGGTVIVSIENDIVSDEVRSALMPLLLIGLGLMAFAALVGWILARRLARPFVQLADAASQLGTGRRIEGFPAEGIPEAVAISKAMRDASARIEELLQHERDVALNASHELRTPIAGLRLSLEDLTLWPDLTDEARTEVTRLVGEVDRLADAVTALLEVARDSSDQGTTTAQVTAMLTASLEQRGETDATVTMTADADRLLHDSLHDLTRALDAVLDLALEHATRPVHVSCEDRGTHVAIVVPVTRLDRAAAEGDHRLQTAREVLAGSDGRVVIAPDSVAILLAVGPASLPESRQVQP